VCERSAKPSTPRTSCCRPERLCNTDDA
jgi:hypothetical protein